MKMAVGMSLALLLGAPSSLEQQMLERFDCRSPAQ